MYHLGGVRLSVAFYYDVNRSVRIRPGPPDLTRWEGKPVLQATVLAARDPASFGSKAGRPINDFQVRGRSALSGHENPFKGSIRRLAALKTGHNFFSEIRVRVLNFNVVLYKLSKIARKLDYLKAKTKR